jgi:hypothetical protein
MMPTVRIDDEVYERLQRDAVPFVDTPNTVLRRVLGLDPTDSAGSRVSPDGSSTGENLESSGGSRQRGAATPPRQRERARRGSLLPEEEYELPILTVLDEFGGEASTAPVVDAVGKVLMPRFTPLDSEALPSGGLRWRNRVQWARKALTERGLLDPGAPRGIWRLTDAGREELARRR